MPWIEVGNPHRHDGVGAEVPAHDAVSGRFVLLVEFLRDVLLGFPFSLVSALRNQLCPAACARPR